MSDEICWFLIENSLVIQKSYFFVEGWIEGPIYVTAGFTYDGTNFIAPIPDYLAINTDKLNLLLKLATAQVTAIQGRVDAINDAIDLDEALPSEIAELPIVTALLKKWKSYRILLGRVTLQVGWPPEPIWPVMPETYNNDTSAVSPNTAQTI